MSARSQNHDQKSVEEFHLACSLRDCLASGVIIINHDGQITSCNPDAQRLLSLPAPEKKSLPSISLLPVGLQNLIREVIADGISITREHLKLTPREGLTHTFHVSLTPIQSDPPGVVIVLNDLGGFVQLEQRAAQLDRLATIGTLSATIAHEVKNALVSIKTFVDLLLEKNRDAELSDVVEREMKRMESIIRQMLKFGGPARPNFSTVRLHDVLEQSLRMVQHQLDGKLISLNRSFKATPDAIHGDDNQLEQAFVNLFLNAAEATGANGTLTVATEIIPVPATSASRRRNHSSQLHITVADTGVGIAPENIEKLFEPFFTTKHNGTGLGLPITRRIIREHSGDITVESKPNKGTTFLIRLPIHCS